MSFTSTPAAPNFTLRMTIDPQPDAAMDQNEDPDITDFKVFVDGPERVIISGQWNDATHYDLLVTGNVGVTLTTLELNVTNPNFRTDPSEVAVIAPQVVHET